MKQGSLFIIFSAAALASGCARSSVEARTTTGVLAGGALGALAGKAVGLDPVSGAAIGAVAGGAIGYATKGIKLGDRQYYKDSRGYCYYVDQQGVSHYDPSVRC